MARIHRMTAAAAQAISALQVCIQPDLGQAPWPHGRLPKLVAGRPHLPVCPGDRALCLIYHMAIHQAGRNASGLAPPYSVKNQGVWYYFNACQRVPNPTSPPVGYKAYSRCGGVRCRRAYLRKHLVICRKS